MQEMRRMPGSVNVQICLAKPSLRMRLALSTVFLCFADEYPPFQMTTR